MPWKKVRHFSPALSCDRTIRSNTTFVEENLLYIVSISMSPPKTSAGHASGRFLKFGTDFKDNVCSTDVIAPEEKLNECSKYESTFSRPIQKSAFIDWLICPVKMSDLKILYVDSTLLWNPGHSASREWSCRDAGQHGTNPGHPGKSGTGGNSNEGEIVKLQYRTCGSDYGFRVYQQTTTATTPKAFCHCSLDIKKLPSFFCSRSVRSVHATRLSGTLKK